MEKEIAKVGITRFSRKALKLRKAHLRALADVCIKEGLPWHFPAAFSCEAEKTLKVSFCFTFDSQNIPNPL